MWTSSGEVGSARLLNCRFITSSCCRRYLLAERTFERITIFEQRSTVGGLWNYVPCSEETPRDLPVPQTSPHARHDEPTWEQSAANGVLDPRCEEEMEFTTPLYDRLETNIPRGLMGFSDLDWPSSCQLFPKHGEVLQYIEQYAGDVRHLVQFKKQVLDVRLNADQKWTVETRAVSPRGNGAIQQHKFDAIVVASGHFDVPYLPSVLGIETWNKAYPEVISHSKFYRKPEHYANKKVIVVGNSASGVDIGAQISTLCKLPLIQSTKSDSFLQPHQSSTKLEKPEIVEFILEDRTVRFSDGTTESNIDAILYCTGYFYSFPFLNSLPNSRVITTGEYVENLFQHTFYRPHSTLAFATLNQKIIPFPVAEAQSAVIARVWSGRLDLPSADEMAEWEQDTLQETGGGSNFHVLKFPKDADYINMLHDWAISAERRASSHQELRRRRMSSSGVDGAAKRGSNGDCQTVGKEPPYWGEKEYWTRERFPAIKKAFQSFGEDRYSKRTLEDVGFSFEQWREEKIEETKRLL